MCVTAVENSLQEQACQDSFAGGCCFCNQYISIHVVPSINKLNLCNALKQISKVLHIQLVAKSIFQVCDMNEKILNGCKCWKEEKSPLPREAGSVHAMFLNVLCWIVAVILNTKQGHLWECKRNILSYILFLKSAAATFLFACGEDDFWWLLKAFSVQGQRLVCGGRTLISCITAPPNVLLSIKSLFRLSAKTILLFWFHLRHFQTQQTAVFSEKSLINPPETICRQTKRLTREYSGVFSRTKQVYSDP